MRSAPSNMSQGAQEADQREAFGSLLTQTHRNRCGVDLQPLLFLDHFAMLSTPCLRGACRHKRMKVAFVCFFKSALSPQDRQKSGVRQQVHLFVPGLIIPKTYIVGLRYESVRRIPFCDIQAIVDCTSSVFRAATTWSTAA